MGMPPLLPTIEPEIPDGYRFIAVTLRDPARPVVIMHWPTKRRNFAGGPEYDYAITPERVEARFQQEQLDVVRWRVIPYAEIPKDRTYRDAWTDTGAKLDHDMPKAREIHRAHLRASRFPKLEALDVEYQRADERNDTAEKKRIAGLKQTLRDVTALPEIDAAETVEALKEVWPDLLT